MVLREHWMTCTLDDLCSELAAKNCDNQFSTIPVVVDHRVLGLLDAARWFDHPAPEAPVAMITSACPTTS